MAIPAPVLHHPMVALSSMAFSPARHRLCFLLFIISLTFLPFNSPSVNLDNERDFREWISLNAKDFKQKTVVFNSVATSKPRNGSRRSFDIKLLRAEAKKVFIKVAQNGSGDFQSLREAIENIKENNTNRIIIQIAPGVYREKIVIKRSLPFITLLGNVQNPPTLTWNDTAVTLGTDGLPMGTFHSASVAISADYFVAANIRFENTAPYPDIGTTGGQAVALRISGNKAAFYNCSFYGTQDTLYDHEGLHYFKNCFIQGSVDFIFGYGRSLYENCYLNSISKNVTSITAQKRTNVSLSSGFSFLNSEVTGSGLVYLGRAWGDHSRVVFAYTYLDKVVIPQGWNSWDVPPPEKSLYYGEYKCRGPGANVTGRVPWARILTDEQAAPFLGTYYVDGQEWILSAN